MSGPWQVTVETGPVALANGAFEQQTVSEISIEIARFTAAMARGEETAYRQFFTSYFDRLFRYLVVVSGGHEELAREALQGTLIRVAHHVREFTCEPAFWSWLTVLARSALRDEARRQIRYRKLVVAFVDSRAVETGDSAPEEQRLDLLMHRALAELPPADRQLIEAKYLNQQSVREIALATGTSEKAIESRLTRIRRHLRKDLLNRLKHSEEP